MKFRIGDSVIWNKEWKCPDEINPGNTYKVEYVGDVKHRSNVGHSQWITVTNDKGKADTFTGACWKLTEDANEIIVDEV